MKLSVLKGVGPKTAEKLAQLGVHEVADLLRPEHEYLTVSGLSTEKMQDLRRQAQALVGGAAAALSPTTSTPEQQGPQAPSTTPAVNLGFVSHSWYQHVAENVAGPDFHGLRRGVVYELVVSTRPRPAVETPPTVACDVVTFCRVGYLDDQDQECFTYCSPAFLKHFNLDLPPLTLEVDQEYPWQPWLNHVLWEVEHMGPEAQLFPDLRPRGKLETLGLPLKRYTCD